MDWMKVFFWFLLFGIFYSYLGYGMALWVYLKIKNFIFKRKTPPNTTTYRPHVAMVVAAYNEQDFIRKKIENTIGLDYPADKLSVYFVTDGSTDETMDIVQQFPAVKLLHHPERKGKIAAMNRALDHVADSEILIFSDANTLLNKDCILRITRHYIDPGVGGVSGEKKILSSGDVMVQGKGEGLYWKYESFLKKIDSDFYSVVGAAGELFSVRKSLFEKVPEGCILDDFIISLNVCRKGYVVKYEPQAYASETPSVSIVDEQKRKVRISAGGFQSLVMMKDLLNIFRYGKLSFLYISHRVLRWAFCPFALPLLFLINGAIVWIEQAGPSVYLYLFFAQVVFYLAALAGRYFAGKKGTSIKIFYVPYYFVFMNLSVWAGLFRFLKGNQTVMWEKASRQMAV
jgi:cellulose synthase/poly-beta-1,6-N-acetylglucosamine synthase-like glycosyltransferase